MRLCIHSQTSMVKLLKFGSSSSSSKLYSQQKTMNIIHESKHNIYKWIHIVNSVGGHQRSQRLIFMAMDKLFYPTFYNGCNYLSMLGLKLNHVSKRGPQLNQKVTYVSVNWITIGCVNSLLLIGCQANPWPKSWLIKWTWKIFFTQI